VDSLIRSGEQGKAQLQTELQVDEEILEMLVDNWTDVDRRDYSGRSLLHYAAYKGYKKLAKVLLAKGANPKLGVGPREDRGIHVGDFKLGWSTLHFAAKEGHVEIAQLLLDNGADANGASFYLIESVPDETPLHVAAEAGRKNVVELLIAHDADVNAKSLIVETPLHSAIRGGHKEIMKLLLDNNADTNTQPGHLRMSPLHLAVAKASADICEMLLQRGAKTESRDLYGYTPLHYAVIKGNTDVVRALVNGGADTNAKIIPDKDEGPPSSCTPFVMAIQLKHTQIVQVMLNKGANIGTIHEDMTPLDWAMDCGNSEIVELLRSHGAKSSNELQNEDK
jgi:ankyrin repeat protein